MEDIIRLNINDKVKVYEFLEDIIEFYGFGYEVTNKIKENRFSKGKVYPYCGHEEVTRYRRYNKKQRYKCKSCKKTFTDFTRSPISNSKKDIDLWIKYVSCMINGYSVRKCAKEVGISVPTSYYWGHKVLDAVRAYLGMGSVGGGGEADELFFRESFKGNHKKSTNFSMPRKARERGPTGSYGSRTS